MKLSKKDQSFLLLVAAIVVIFYSIYSLFSYLFFNATFHKSDVNKIFVQDKAVKSQEWLNVSRPLVLDDVKDRIILLDFWTYSCVNCANVLAEIKKLEEQFGSKITVIGVHSGMFENDKDLAAIKKAILKNEIDYPVINDSDLRIWNEFKITAWPSLVLINPHGNVEKTYIGEEESLNVKSGIKKLISKFQFNINREELPIDLEKNRITGNVLSFPTKIEYSSKFEYKSRQIPALFIANSGKNNIVITSLTGEIILKIGSEKKGFEDGDFESASFNSPRGMLYYNDKLFVADSGNNALREIDFKTGKVTTLVGSGQKGKVMKEKIVEASHAELSAPTDIEFFPNHENIVIANSGTNQLLNYDIKNQTVEILAGNGEQGIKDGIYPNNSLAQTSDLAVYGKHLYFLDSQSSALRVIDEENNVKTLIGYAAKSGYKNGDKSEALMQHPSGLMVDDTGAYISDSFNHVIRKYDFSSSKIRNFIGGKKRGDAIGSESSTEFDEPEGIVAVLNEFYIVDSNNNRILSVNRGNLNSELLDVMPPLKLTKEGYLQYLPNLQRRETVTVAADKEISVTIDLKKGWKINEAGPSFINLIELTKDTQADLLATFDWNVVKEKNLKLPKLNSGKNYTLQGVIYYCEDKKNALCYVKSYEQKFEVNSGEKKDKVIIKLDK